PWAVADKWDEYLMPNEPDYPSHDPDWNTDESFDKYGDRQGRNPEPDLYVPPDGNGPGTGFRVYDEMGSGTRVWRDYGTQLTLKLGDSERRYSSGWFLALRLGDSTGGDDYRENIKNCIGVQYKIGDVLDVSTEQGNKVGPTRQGVEDDSDSLVAKDPNAWWDPNAAHPSGKGRIAGSDFAVSPRLVPVPVFSLDEYLATNPTGRSTVKIRNILGFFVEGMGGPGRQDVIGRLVTYPGFTVGNSTLTGPSSFMKQIILVR
ncbi:MAG: hypothetical protein ACRD1T_16185, partial [Acidimicrobiia bacterium]